MLSFTRISRHALAVSAAALTVLAVAPAPVEARSNEVTNWSDEDFALYPTYCRARILREPPELEAYWEKQFGPKNFLHMHHFCFGLKALNLAYANLQDAGRRTSLAQAVIGNFNYIIEHTERDFYMRPEALTNLGRGYVRTRQYEQARKSFQAALKLNPKSVDAWVALSDMYHQKGQYGDAMKVLEKALAEAGDSKKITLRIADMKAKGQK